ncbi:MAG: hypothetical protein PHT42_01265 [Thermotogota bacterium]|nr:hypothetical protein [Thermotogota bacterium]
MGNAFSNFLKKSHLNKRSFRRWPLTAALIAVFLCIGGNLSAVTSTGSLVSNPSGGIGVYAIAVHCNQTEIPLGGVFTVIVKVRHNPSERVGFQGLESLHESLAITGISTTTQWLTANFVEDRWIYTLVPSQTGAFHFPPLTATLSEPGTVTDLAMVLSSVPFYLDVYAVTDRFGFAEPGLTAVMPIPPWVRWIAWVIAFGLLIPCILIIRKAFIRPKPVKGMIRKPASVDNLELLEELKKEYSLLLKDYKTIDTPEQAKEFYYRLSRFVRSYIDAAYRTQLLMKTPEEIRSEFSGSKEIEIKMEEEIVRFLIRCDAVKYRPILHPTETIDSDIKSLKKITASVSKRKIG